MSLAESHLLSGTRADDQQHVGDWIRLDLGKSSAPRRQLKRNILTHPLAQTTVGTQLMSFSLNGAMSRCGIDSHVCHGNVEKTATTIKGGAQLDFLSGS